MTLPRFLFLVLLTVTLALTGPFSRGLSAQAGPVGQGSEVSRTGAVSTLQTGAAPSKRCLRGAVAWTSCALDLGHVPARLSIAMGGSGMDFDRVLDGTSGDVSRSRLFRPPRTG